MNSIKLALWLYESDIQELLNVYLSSQYVSCASQWDTKVNNGLPFPLSRPLPNIMVHQDRIMKKFCKLSICLFILAVLGLRCYVWAFSSCGEQGLLFVAVRGLLIAVASLVADHGLQAHRLQYLRHVGSVVAALGLQGARASVVVAYGLSYSAACGIFPDQGLNLCPLHWQADS